MRIALSIALLFATACSEPTPAFDIVYPREWRFSVAGPVEGFVLVVNTSKRPLAVSTLEVRSVVDDHPAASLNLVAAPSSATLAPGTAGGQLSLLSRDLLTPLTPEDRADTDRSYLSLEIADAPPGTYDIAAVATLRLDGLDVTMPILVHVVPGPVVVADPVLATRLVINR